MVGWCSQLGLVCVFGQRSEGRLLDVYSSLNSNFKLKSAANLVHNGHLIVMAATHQLSSYALFEFC